MSNARERSEHPVPDREEVRLTSFRRDLKNICWAVDQMEWRGRPGTTELDVMRELLAVAELRGTLVFGMNLRSIAERIGVSVSTVWSAIRRLKVKGFLKVGRADRLPQHSTTWRLCYPEWFKTEQRPTAIQTFLIEEHCSDLPHSHLDITVAHDAFAGPGGKTRHRVLAAAQRNRGRIAHLARATTLSPSCVRSHLYVLEHLGLVVRDGKMWRAGRADLDQTADLLGTAGAGDRRRKRHRLERAGFRAGLQRARERRLKVDSETGEVLERPRPHPGLVAHAETLFGARTIEVRRVAETR